MVECVCQDGIWRESRSGNRCSLLFGKTAINIPNAHEYAHILRTEGMVEPDLQSASRKHLRAVEKQSGCVSNTAPRPLLDEVNSLTEYPVVYKAEFEPEFCLYRKSA